MKLKRKIETVRKIKAAKKIKTEMKIKTERNIKVRRIIEVRGNMNLKQAMRMTKATTTAGGAIMRQDTNATLALGLRKLWIVRLPGATTGTIPPKSDGKGYRRLG